MRDDRRVRRCAVGIAVALGGALCAARAGAQDARASAQLQYQHTDGAGLAAPYETWGKTVTADWWHRLPGFDVSSRVRFTEQTVVGRQTRFRNPEGVLRLGHRYFGLSTQYTPTESRDDRGITSRQKSLALNAFFQKDGLPSIAGSWRRTTQDLAGSATGASVITRTLNANYGAGPVALRAGVGDRILARRSDGHRPTDNLASIGASSQFRLGRMPVTAQYDFTQNRANPSVTKSYVARTHAAQASASYEFTPRTTAALAYSYRLADQVATGLPRDRDQSGSATLSHAFNRALGLSGSGGLRSVTLAGNTQTERYAAATASAQGQARPGWLISSSLSHDTSWLPGDRGHSTESFNSGTTMRLNTRISARADAGLSVMDRAVATAGSRKDVALRGGAGLAATPLRTLYVDASVNRNRSGAGVFARGDLSTAWSTTVRLMPTSRFNLSGGHSVLQSSGSRGTTSQASFTWSPTALLHASGSYNRTRQNLLLTGTSSPLQESYSGTVTTSPGGRLNIAFQYQEVNPRQASRVRQYNVLVAREFGR